MTIPCVPLILDSDDLERRMLAVYERLAREPGGRFHFHRGGAYAVSLLGYDEAELAALPERAVARFAGVGRPLALGGLAAGETVLDHACGAGTDVLLAARRVGPSGRVIGVDFSPAMRAHAEQAALEAGLGDRVDIRAGRMEHLPVADASVDVVLSNGVVNLSPDKPRVFDEIARVLRPGGRLMLCDVVIAHELRPSTRANPDLWAACVAGALQPWELIGHLRAAGLEVTPFCRYWSCFRGADVEEKLVRSLLPRAIGLQATRPA